MRYINVINLLLAILIDKIHECIAAHSYNHVSKHTELNVVKGKFLVHMLHSAYFFPQTVRYNTSTKQVAEFKIKNVEAEEFMDQRNDHVRRLEKAIHETFRGKTVQPYIYNIFPEIQNLPEDFHKIAHRVKIGTIVQIGTQNHFHPNLHNILDGMRRNPDYCKKNSYIPMNKNFKGFFNVDWCKFDIKNITMIKTLDPLYVKPAIYRLENPYLPEKAISTNASNQVQIDKYESRKTMEYLSEYYPPMTNSFWESVLIFPLLAVFCILLILFLSVIFFGRREGQQWRDYKTSKDKLSEYLSVRESQNHLRDLTVQRQMLLMSYGRGKSSSPVGITTFLQPKYPLNPTIEDYKTEDYRNSQPPKSPSYSRRNPMGTRANSNSRADDAPNYAFTTPRNSIGKQTVAEAARATGSSLHLYRNPLNDDSYNNEENDGDSDPNNDDYSSQKYLHKKT